MEILLSYFEFICLLYSYKHIIFNFYYMNSYKNILVVNNSFSLLKLKYYFPLPITMWLYNMLFILLLFDPPVTIWKNICWASGRSRGRGKGRIPPPITVVSPCFTPCLANFVIKLCILFVFLHIVLNFNPIIMA